MLIIDSFILPFLSFKKIQHLLNTFYDQTLCQILKLQLKPCPQGAESLCQKLVSVVNKLASSFCSITTIVLTKMYKISSPLYIFSGQATNVIFKTDRHIDMYPHSIAGGLTQRLYTPAQKLQKCRILGFLKLGKQ